jgi:uncharacterized protein with von Willebrand factor type A (vWA) domain
MEHTLEEQYPELSDYIESVDEYEEGSILYRHALSNVYESIEADARFSTGHAVRVNRMLRNGDTEEALETINSQLEE